MFQDLLKAVNAASDARKAYEQRKKENSEHAKQLSGIVADAWSEHNLINTTIKAKNGEAELSKNGIEYFDYWSDENLIELSKQIESILITVGTNYSKQF